MDLKAGNGRQISGPFTIMFEVESLDRGGLENVVFDLAKLFDTKLFRVIVVCVNSGGHAAQRLEGEGIKVEVLGEEKEKAFLVLLDRYNVDLLFAHHSFLGAPLAHRMNIPVLSVLHNMYFWFGPDVLSVFREQDPFVHKYVAVSTRVRDFIASRFKIPQEKIAVIPNGIDPGKIEEYARKNTSPQRIDWGLKDDDVVFLNVAAINPVKNQNLILEAVQQLKENYPRIKVLIVGKILSESYQNFLQDKLKLYDLTDTVRFIEFTERIYDLYSLADAFLLPSFIEGWSLAAMEAFSFGLPLILSSVGSAVDLEAAGADVLLLDLFPDGMVHVDNDDVLRLAKNPKAEHVSTLCRIMRETIEKVPELRKRRSFEPARAGKFSIDTMVKSYAKEILGVLENARTGNGPEGVEYIRTRLEHLFKEMWDFRHKFIEVEGTSKERHDQIMHTADQDRSVFQQWAQQWSRVHQTSFEQAQEERRHLQIQIAQLNARLSQIDFQLAGLSKHVDDHFQELMLKLTDLAYVQRDIMNRLSIKERLRSLKNKITGRNVPIEHPIQEPEAQIVRYEPEMKEIKKYAIICLPIIDWEFRFQRPQQLLSRFADAGHRVYYATVLMDIALERYYQRTMRDNVSEVRFSTPRSLNIYKDQIDEETASYLAKSVWSLAKERDLREVVLVVQFPSWGPLVRKLNHESGWRVVYDCMDEHSGFSDVGNRFLKQEEALMRDSDLVVVSSRKLLEKARKLNDNVALIPNAADFDHFANPKPNDNFKLDHPIIGYFGAIAEWFDYDAVISAAEKHRDWNFVLIGDLHGQESERLKKHSNITLTGEIPYQELPGYLAHFDVCIIPMRITPLIEATNPVKFFEYLCTGKPIVAADLPELHPFKDLFYCYSGTDDFAEKIESALRESLGALKKKRIEVARENEWDSRFNVLSQKINHLFPLVSIIIPSYNNLNYLKMGLNSLRINSLYPNIEIVVVDNASDGETVAYLKKMEQEWDLLSVIYNESNVGFARANNQAAKVARGEYLVLLNDDVVVTKGWLTGLLGYFRNPEVGMVGPVTNSCGNEACIDVPYNDVVDMDSFARDYTLKNKGKFFEIDVLAFFCTVIPRRVWNLAGMLDEQYEIGMFEDDDYALRVKEQGFKLICAQDVFVHHFGRASFSRMGDEAYNELFTKNKRRFEEKWDRPWRAHTSL